MSSWGMFKIDGGILRHGYRLSFKNILGATMDKNIQPYAKEKRVYSRLKSVNMLEASRAKLGKAAI